MSELYDLDALLRGRDSILANIKSIEAALEQEHKKLAEYEEHIENARAILKQHGVKYDGSH